jgi:hypothetical protein
VGRIRNKFAIPLAFVLASIADPVVCLQTFPLDRVRVYHVARAAAPETDDTRSILVLLTGAIYGGLWFDIYTLQSNHEYHSEECKMSLDDHDFAKSKRIFPLPTHRRGISRRVVADVLLLVSIIKA